MEQLILIALIGILIIVSFVIGLKCGYKVSNNLPIEIPKFEPIKTIKRNIEENKINKEIKEQEEEVTNWLDTVDNYTGYEVKNER